MSSLFDFDARPDAYAVMGNPIAHSKSPRIHTLFAEQTAQRIEYTAILVDPGGFDQAVGNFAAAGGKGLNVTVPFKREAWEFVDERSDRAEHAGAVNTVKIEKNGRLFGDNTDGIGLVTDLTDNQGWTLGGRRLLLLGAGGAARGVLGPLLEQAPAHLYIANRTPDRAVDLIEEFSGRAAGTDSLDGGGFEHLSGQTFDVVINATAASLAGEALPLPDGILAPEAKCYDMMYGAEPTAFMRWAMEAGAGQVADGLGMLVEQAAESFYLWRGVRPQTQPVIAQLRAEL
ncbi:MAG TPA: shikimate dehydrogenase [Gammaproteobacteria bacterium]|nr:shikimate dehydrogenase [Gammaproteobacteria bacterium]